MLSLFHTAAESKWSAPISENFINFVRIKPTEDMKVINLGKDNSVLNNFMAQLRDKDIQKDRMRFRKNLERIGEIFAYEISRTLDYSVKEVVTPLGIAEVPTLDTPIVAATILRAGLPLHQGILNFLENSQSAFVAAYRKYDRGDSFHINIEYSSGNISVLSKTFEDRLRTLPFVKAVAQSQGTPADGGNNATTRFDGEKSPSSFQFINATPELLKIYGLKLETDLHVKGDSIVYLNEKAMKQLKMKPTDTHLNNRYRQIRYSYLGRNPRLGGIVSDFRIRNILVEPCAMIIQLCNKVEAPWEVSILVEGDPADAYAKIKKVYREVFHEDVEEESDPFVDKQVEAYFEKEIRTTKIVSLFAVAAIIISMLGLVAMSTYFIQQRAREIAIRKVFGSTGNQVRRRLISTFMTYVAVAFVIAVPIVVHFMGNWIEQYNYRITWWPWIIAAGAAVMAISYAAVAVQSRAAANENPVKNIRQE